MRRLLLLLPITCPITTTSALVVHRSFDIGEMLLQRTIQTMVHHYAQLRNEPVSNWLSEFRGHEHLDRGNKWHSCMGMRCSCEEYLSDLVGHDDVTLQVDYGIGIGFTMHPVNEKEDLETAPLEDSPLPKELCTWADSAAARRKNPYLEQQGQRSYEETIRPRNIARQLMALTGHLKREWEDDLQRIASQPIKDDEVNVEERARIAAEQQRRIKDSDGTSGGGEAIAVAAVANGRDARAARVVANRERVAKSLAGGYSAVGPVGGESSAAHAFSLALADDEDSTPLRLMNSELLERAVMFQASERLLAELRDKSSRKKGSPSTAAATASAEAVYLEHFMERWNPLLMGEGFAGLDDAIGLSLPLAVQQTPVAGVMFEALTHRPPIIVEESTSGSSSGGKRGPKSSNKKNQKAAKRLVVDPPSIAKRLLCHRRHAAEALASELADVDAVLTAVQKRSLDVQLSSVVSL